MKTSEISIAQTLLRSKAVTLNVAQPYTYSSGIKSPIYCDNRLLITDLATRKQITDAFCERIVSLNPKQIAGVATAGITWGAWIAEKLQLPFIYVRPKPKGHGKEKQIEGNFIREKTVLIEDLISTGGSSIQALDALRAEKIPTNSMVAIFTYGFDSAKKLFEEKDIQTETLTNLNALLDEAIAGKYLNVNDKAEVLRWRQDPQNWFKA